MWWQPAWIIQNLLQCPKSYLMATFILQEAFGSITSLCQQQIYPDEIFYSLGYFCFMFYLQLLSHFWSLLYLLVLFYLCGLNGRLWFRNPVQQLCTYSIKPNLRFRCYYLSFISFYCFTCSIKRTIESLRHVFLNMPGKKIIKRQPRNTVTMQHKIMHLKLKVWREE